MKKYILLTLLAGGTFIACQQVDETKSTPKTALPKAELSNKNNTAIVENDKEAAAKVETDSESQKSASPITKESKRVEKEPKKANNTPKTKVTDKQKPVKKTKKKKPPTKKPEKKLSTDLVKNSKTAAKNNKSNLPLPILQFESKTFNFGTVDDGDTIRHKFKFTNVGKAPAIISDASSSCGCTVPSFPRKPIAPGKSGIIEVMFNTKGQLLEQKKSVTITANTEPKYNTLYLEGNVYRRPPPPKEDKKEDDSKEKEKASKNKKKSDSKNNKKKASSKKDNATNKKTNNNQKKKPKAGNEKKIDSLKNKNIDLNKQKKKKP